MRRSQSRERVSLRRIPRVMVPRKKGGHERAGHRIEVLTLRSSSVGPCEVIESSSQPSPITWGLPVAGSLW